MPVNPPGDEISTKRGYRTITYERPTKVGDPPGHRRFQIQCFIDPIGIPDDLDKFDAGDKVNFDAPDLEWKTRSGHFVVDRAMYAM